jgi:argininosuccinate lyase
MFISPPLIFVPLPVVLSTLFPPRRSLDSVADRDFIAEFCFWSSLTGVHLSQLGEDLILYGSGEFGFLKFSDAYSTGSSLMPQKKNPDALELLRGKAGRTTGHLVTLLVTLKGLPSTYNKDLQEDKEPLFDSVDTMNGCLKIADGVLGTLTVNSEKMAAALTTDMLATDLADYLVRRGVPFRKTHHVAGSAVQMAEDRGAQISDLSVEELQSLHPSFEEDVLELWSMENSVERKDAMGGTRYHTR